MLTGPRKTFQWNFCKKKFFCVLRLKFLTIKRAFTFISSEFQLICFETFWHSLHFHEILFRMIPLIHRNSLRVKLPLRQHMTKENGRKEEFRLIRMFLRDLIAFFSSVSLVLPSNVSFGECWAERKKNGTMFHEGFMPRRTTSCWFSVVRELWQETVFRCASVCYKPLLNSINARVLPSKSKWGEKLAKKVVRVCYRV